MDKILAKQFHNLQSFSQDTLDVYEYICTFYANSFISYLFFSWVLISVYICFYGYLPNEIYFVIGWRLYFLWISQRLDGRFMSLTLCILATGEIASTMNIQRQWEDICEWSMWCMSCETHQLWQWIQISMQEYWIACSALPFLCISER